VGGTEGIVAAIMAIGRAMVAQDEPQPEYSMFFVGRQRRQHHRPAALCQGAVDQQFACWVMLHVQSNPLPIAGR
jgi:hypothetical protein